MSLFAIIAAVQVSQSPLLTCCCCCCCNLELLKISLYFILVFVVVVKQSVDHQDKTIFICQRPYHVENTSSRPITEVKQHRAQLVLGWVTAWERCVPLAISFFGKSYLLIL